MKKLALAAVIAIAIVSCKKEPVQPSGQTNASVTHEQQVADLIQRADQNLYSQIYGHNQRMPHVGISEIKGVFVWTNDVASGTCFPHPTCICMLIVSALKGESNDTTGVVPVEIRENYSATFSTDSTTTLILNTSPTPRTKEIESFDAVFEEEEITISWKEA